MAGRRLLDAARLFSAARSVASQHVALRSQQLDTYNKTSTLARAVKSQTDRVTLTAQAAYTLAKRFSEDVPKYNSPTERWKPGDDFAYNADASVGTQGPDYKQEDGTGSSRPVGLEQDHHYNRDEGNSTRQPKPKDEMEVTQEEAAEEPLPDGTIPPTDNNINRPPTPGEVLDSEKQGKDSTHELGPRQARYAQRLAEEQIPRIFAADEAGKETIENKDINASVFSEPSENETTAYSSLPRAKLPKVTEDTQGGDSHVDDGKLNQDVFYSSKGNQQPQQIPQKKAVPEQEEIPEGINTDVFHSPKVAKMLSGRDKRGYGLDLRNASRTPIEQSKLQEGKDQDTFNVRQSTGRATPLVSAQTPPNSAHTSDQEMRDLAADIAKDASVASSATSEPVRFEQHYISNVC